MSALRRDIVRKVRQVGVLQTLRHASQKLLREFRRNLRFDEASQLDGFDSEYGTDTAQIVSVGAMDISDDKLEQTNRYQAVVPDVFFAIMQELPIEHNRFVFIDIGCGKGRALLLASRFPFKEIVGVELSPALTAVARRNIVIFRGEKQESPDIQVVCNDAANYNLPPYEIVLYLNNPFGEVVMGLLARNVETSLCTFGRKIYVVYQLPLHRDVWDQSAKFQRIRQTDNFIIYESK